MTKAPYDYNISPEYDRTIFAKLVSFLTKSIDNIEESKYLEDPLDGDQIQIIKTPDGEIKVINDFMVGALWIESEVNLDDILKEFDYA